MTEITISAGQVDLLHDMDLVTLHQAATFNRASLSGPPGDQGSWDYTLRATCENLISVINALPVDEIQPDPYWATLQRVKP